MSKECTCPLGADECTGDSGIFWPLQDGGSCATRQCQEEKYDLPKEQNDSY